MSFNKFNSNIITVLLQNELKSETTNSISNLGLGIQGEKPSNLIIFPGGVADRMGLKNDDELLAINGITLNELNHLNVVTKLSQIYSKNKEMLRKQQKTKKTMPEEENLFIQRNSGNKNKKAKTEEENQQKNKFSFRKFPMPVKVEGGYQSRWINNVFLLIVRTFNIKSLLKNNLKLLNICTYLNRLQPSTKFKLNYSPNILSNNNINKINKQHRRSSLTLSSSINSTEFSKYYFEDYSTKDNYLLLNNKQPIAIFVIEFIGKFTKEFNKLINYNINIFEKILNIEEYLNISNNIENEQIFCVLFAYEDQLQILPFIFDELNNKNNLSMENNINYNNFNNNNIYSLDKLFFERKQIISILRSQINEKIFGILIKNKQNIFECFIFKTLPENLQKHNEHFNISEIMNIKCRIVANIRFLQNIPYTSSSSYLSPNKTKEKIKNIIVNKFLSSIGGGGGIIKTSLGINNESFNNSSFDNFDENNYQNTSTESNANSGDLFDPEEEIFGENSFYESKN
ncbi:hypothetical protein Mgra_00008412 [Meloidogyne graminicola]|uniref:PDZ domain-containing protein n=1 Tax=Meloidogyne graminicola TaxID=189291 RepID=A0A8S9ZFT2_9BILA|nr:hypothetical protein Mgra_00008412 [Meloidogyne graminicola]